MPAANSLRVVFAFDAVAPREQLQLSATGGAGGYRFSFAPNGKLSGESASLTESGAYQAGERGLAQDVVRVTDASNTAVDARIAVTAPLSLSPAIAAVAPGGAVRFVPTGPARTTNDDCSGWSTDAGTALGGSMSGQPPRCRGRR